MKLGELVAVLFQGSVNHQHLESAGIEQREIAAAEDVELLDPPRPRMGTALSAG